MKYSILFTAFAFTICFELKAQSQQFAVVRPNGTTYICPTIDSAYNKALNGDFLYLPGGSFSLTHNIAKSIHIYGAGIHPDSSAVTTRTILNGVNLNTGAGNGSIIGCYLGGITLVSSVDNYSITNCYIGGGFGMTFEANGFIITNNIIGSYTSCLYGGGYALILLGQNHLISNNLILGRVQSNGGNTFRNNIFPYTDSYCYSLSCNNEQFENNIFANYNGASNSIFYNNLGVPNGIFGIGNQGYDNYPLDVPFNSLFIEYPAWDTGNLHLVPGSPYENAGNDGTELGIYGGTFPTSEGWVPKNPHIYFKQIDQTTGPDGKLHIEVGVRTNN